MFFPNFSQQHKSHTIGIPNDERMGWVFIAEVVCQHWAFCTMYSLSYSIDINSKGFILQKSSAPKGVNIQIFGKCSQVYRWIDNIDM